MRKATVVVIVLLAGCFRLHAAPTGTPTRPDLEVILAAQVPSFTIKAENLLQASAEIAARFNVPVGIEWNGGPGTQRLITGNWSGETVGSVLQDLVAEDPGYEMKVADGVVHIQPRLFDRNPGDFLNVVVPQFGASNEYTLDAGFRLRDELNALVTSRPAKPAAAACAGSTGHGAGEVRASFEMTNVPVRKILDALLLSSNFSMWVVTFEPQSGPKGYFLTDSLWRKTSDWDQPNWDFVQRYFDPVQMRYRGDWGFRN